MDSGLYEGTVWHERTAPAYRFEHSVFYLSLCLKELDILGERLGVFGHNRRNIVSVFDSDYDGLSDRTWMHEAIAPRSHSDATVSLLTMPRFLGYAFNPVSFFFVRDHLGVIQSVFAEVHNTWGERHLYNLAAVATGRVYRSHATKAFYVSPLLERQAEYDLEIEESTDGRLRILITESIADVRIFVAGMKLTPKKLTRRNLIGSLLRYPFLNVKVIAGIHWHALRTWLLGAKFHPHKPLGSTRGPSS